MLGEEGVREEWGVGGSMGRSGEAERTGMAVGVRAMDESQFRKWFLATMRKRERKALNELVHAKGLIKLNLDARSMLTTTPDGVPTLQIPDLKLISYSLGYSFKTPFSPSKWLSKLTSGGNHEDQRTSMTPISQEAEEDAAEDVLLIEAGVNGKLHELKRQIRLVDQETDREFDREVSYRAVHSRVFPPDSSASSD
ncbi:hypothetical protein KEM54_004687 [Ascosphaera aggregata]|nr:hypothetical protein KEM54_004687 [Ascosphaera aggregata]